MRTETEFSLDYTAGWCSRRPQLRERKSTGTVAENSVGAYFQDQNTTPRDFTNMRSFTNLPANYFQFISLRRASLHGRADELLPSEDFQAAESSRVKSVCADGDGRRWKGEIGIRVPRTTQRGRGKSPGREKEKQE